MAEKVDRTTVSVAREILRAGVKRAEALGYRSFSAYVAYLIEHDTAAKPDHVQVRREKLARFHIEREDEYRAPRAAEEPPNESSTRTIRVTLTPERAAALGLAPDQQQATTASAEPGAERTKKTPPVKSAARQRRPSAAK